MGKLDFQKLLQAYIDWNGLTYEEVAEKLGISRSYVSRIEKGALEILREHC